MGMGAVLTCDDAADDSLIIEVGRTPIWWADYG